MAEPTTLDYRDPDWVAERLSIDKNAVYKLLNEGALPGLQIGRKWLISESSLVQYLKAEERKQTDARRIATTSAWSGDSGGYFARFTERARRTMVFAQQAAIRMNHGYIGQEHLLLGLCEMPECAAARVLANLGVSQDTLRQAVDHLIGRGQEPLPVRPIGLTPRAKRALELAEQQADDLNHAYIGTDHILLGFLAEGSGVAWSILTSLNITMENARAEVVRLASEPPGSAPESPPDGS